MHLKPIMAKIVTKYGNRQCGYEYKFSTKKKISYEIETYY